MKKYITYAMTALFATIAVSIAAPDKDAMMAKEKAAWQAFKDKKSDEFRKVLHADFMGVYADGIQTLQKEMAEQNFSAALRMTMPQIIRQYLRTFDLHQRAKVLEPISRFRRLPGWVPSRSAIWKSSNPWKARQSSEGRRSAREPRSPPAATWCFSATTRTGWMRFSLLSRTLPWRNRSGSSG